MLAVGALVSAMLVPLAASANPTVGYEAHSYSGFNAEPGGAVTGEKPESKLWWHDNAWWAAMISPNAGGAHTIYRLDGTTWQDTGVVIDPSSQARADVLSDGSSLYIATRNTQKLRKFAYTGDGPGAGDGTYVQTTGGGWPVSLPVSGEETLTLAKDTTGRLWVAWQSGGSIHVAHSTTSETSWATFVLPVAGATGVTADDIAGVIAFTDATGPAIGVMWSDQNTEEKRFAIHRDGTDVNTWTVEVAVKGNREVDDHLNLKTFEGAVYAAVKTEKNGNGEPLIRLLERRPNGTWRLHPVARTDERDTRPITVLEIDPAQRQIYVFMSRNPVGEKRHIVYKRTSIDNVGFPVDAVPFIVGDRGINDPTSFKANATASSGIVVMASDSRNYMWNRVGGTGGPPPPPVSYSVTTSTVGQGTVSLNPPGGTYEEGTSVTATATPAAGWSFSHWSGDLTGSTNPQALIVDGNKSITATFTEDDPPPPPPGGTVTAEQTVNGTTTDTNTVTTSAPLTGVNGHLYLAAISTKNLTEVTGVSGLGLTWTRVATQCGGRSQTGVELWRAMGNATSGTVTATLDGTANSTVITVTRYSGVDATTPLGAVVRANTNGTSGACSGGTDGSSYSASIATPGAVGKVHAAVALRNKSHTPGSGFTELAEVSAGSGGRTAGIATQARTPAADPTTVNGTLSGTSDWAMIAVAINGGGGSPPPPPPTSYTVTTSTVGQGSVSLNPPGGTYTAGTSVTATATPAAGWTFSHWSGDLTGSTNPRSFTVNSNMSITANFTQSPPASYTVTTATVGQGSVSLNPPGGTYNAGTSVTATATPAAGWSFSHWTGDLTGSTNPNTFTVNSNMSITANFTEDGPPPPPPGGTVTAEQTVSGATTDSDTVTTSGPLTGVNGHLYLASVSTKSLTAVSSVSGLGLTWVRVATQCGGRSQTGVELWRAMGTATSGTVTATLEGATNSTVITVTRYSGVDPTTPLGSVVRANTNGTSGACSGGSDSASYSASLPTGSPVGHVHAAVALRGKAHSPGAGYTELAEIFAGSGGATAGIATQARTPATDPTTVDGTLSGTSDWAMIAVAIRAAP